jgi:hypothetical protein
LQTRKIFLSLIIGALLIAGLFFVVSRNNSAGDDVALLKPSQLDFTQSNELQQPAGNSEIVGTEAAVELSKTAIFPTPADLNASEQKKWAILEEILKTKNDSDGRVNELIGLSSEFHKALVRKYNSLIAEDRSGRGMIVFLLSRDLQSASDLEFLQKVYQEAPCLSLENCTVVSSDDSPHNAGVNQTTLIYPQLVALYQLEKQLESRPEFLKNPDMRAGILATLKQAETFPVPVVRERAEKIRQKYNL